MGTYQRKIAYLYEYYDQKRVKNVGFLKVDFLQDCKRVLVQARGEYPGEKMTCKLIVKEEKESFQFIDLGYLDIQNGTWMLTIDISKHKNGQLDMLLSHSVGIRISLEGSRYLEATWDDKPLYNIVENPDREKPSMSKKNSEEFVTQNNTCQETTSSENTPEIKSNNNKWSCFEKILKEYPSMQPLPDLDEGMCVRFEPKDIGDLPIRYWYLTGNPFLIQGYCRYRHLVFARIEKNEFAIGVPGIFGEREKIEGENMGFTIFKPLCNCDGCKGAFGYWFMKLSN